MQSPIGRVCFALRACVAALLLGLSAVTAAQAPSADGPAAPVEEASAAALEARWAALEADTSLPDDARLRAVDFLASAVDEQRQSAAAQVKAEALAQRIAAAPARIEELEALLTKDAGPVPEPADHARASLEELTRLDQEAQRELQRARDELAARERDFTSLTALGPSLSEEVASRKRAFRDFRENLAVSAVDELPVVMDALSDYVAAREGRLSAENALAELTLANFDLLVRLATLERDAATLRVRRLDAQSEALASALEARRVRQAKEGRQQAEVAEQAMASLPGPVAALAAENATLREELERVTLRTGQVAEQLRVTNRRASELESDLVTIRERVDTVGPTAAIGRLLRKRLQSLTGIETDRGSAFARSNEIVAATDRRIDLGEQRREMAVITPRVDQILATVPEDEATGFDAAWLREQITVLVTAKRATIDALYEAYGRYLTQANSYDAAQRQLASTAQIMRVFVRRELLWTRTLPAISLSDFSATGKVLFSLFALDSWREALTSARANAMALPAPTLVLLAVVLGLLGMRPWARRRLGALGQLVSRIRTDAFRHTATALGLTFLIAAAWPVVIFCLGWLLGVQESPSAFASQMSVTLEWLARLMAIFAAVRWLLDGDGLSRRHFRWPEPVCLMLRREFRWLTELGLVCVILGVYGGVVGTDEARVALSRPALMIFAVALAVLFWRVFGGRSPLTATMRLRHPHSFAVRTWRVWFPLLVAVPVAIVAAAGAGYNDAARTATLLLIDTGWLVLGVWVLRDVMLRWFTVSERRLRFEQAIKQREEARAERAKLAREEELEPAVSEAAEVEIPEVDYRELGEQGRAVVQVAVILGVLLGLLKLWSDLLPAFTLLDRIELPFTHPRLVEGVEQQVAVTATDVALAVLVLAGTLFAARNLSGLLGFTVLRRLTGDAGAQYAIVTLCQYALVAAGVMYVFSSIGVQWSKLQWLVAALGVGLGFGLQEIVANFVSGIILLLERPVRVGDTVTVGDATGTVSRIRIRATTIVDWDRKELVVPNKEFITGRLLNWTLSNDLLRLIIPVGVAYGSDVRRARELLLEAAHESEHVLDDPAPQTLFDNFGDNALGLELRAYLPSISHLLAARTELHDRIYEKLNAAGIVIAFPQRDVHLDTGTPLDIRVHDASSVRRAPWQRAKDRRS